MIESHYPTTVQLMAGQRTRRQIIFGLLLVALILVCSAMAALSYLYPKTPGYALGFAGLGVFVLLALPVVIWHKPHAALYILFCGTSIFGEGFSIRATIPTSYIPMWLNISTVGQQYGTQVLSPLVFSIAELLMIVSVLSWIVRQIAMRELKIEWGTLMVPISLYSLAVFCGFLRGMSSGGDRTMALYEVRAQATFLLAYLMAANMIKDRNQVKTLFWVGTFSIGALACMALFTYFTLPTPVGPEGFLPHDDSLLFNLLVFIAMLSVLIRLDKRLIFWAALFTPIAISVALANQRRAGIAAFIIAFLPLAPMLWKILHERRKQIMAFIVVFFLSMAVYLPVAWNGEGAWALPARAIRSQSDPSGRDASSDYYRMAENANLKITRDTSPWIGIGYGKPYAQFFYQPGKTTGFMDYMPHNCILWVWMRIGHIGFFTFLMMFAAILIRGGQTLQTVNDPWLKAIGTLAIMFVLMMFTMGKYDLVLTMSRQMFTMGMLVGILGILKKLDRDDTSQEAQVV